MAGASHVESARSDADEVTRLTQEIARKDALLRELHHSVRNNLQVIASILSLQESRAPDAIARRAFRESRNRARAMALVHETLRGEHDLARVDFRAYVARVTGEVARSFGDAGARVTFELDLVDAPVAFDSGVNLGLLLNELVSNALKHAFPDGRAGRVRVTLARAGADRLVLEVADDGIGLPANVDPATTQTLGLPLASALAQQVGGTLELERGAGTTGRVAFPVAEVAR